MPSPWTTSHSLERPVIEDARDVTAAASYQHHPFATSPPCDVGDDIQHHYMYTASSLQPSLRRAYLAFVADLVRNLHLMWDQDGFRRKYEHRLGGKIHPTTQDVR